MEIGWEMLGILPPFYHPPRMLIFKYLKRIQKANDKFAVSLALSKRSKHQLGKLAGRP
jgi:excinuclease UvrABC nuclease subunit